MSSLSETQILDYFWKAEQESKLAPVYWTFYEEEEPDLNGLFFRAKTAGGFFLSYHSYLAANDRRETIQKILELDEPETIEEVEEAVQDALDKLRIFEHIKIYK